ncbi:unnamed protein product, partial [Aphanomyces euteiches]
METIHDEEDCANAQDTLVHKEVTPKRKKRFAFKPIHDEKLLLEVLGDEGIFNTSMTKGHARMKIERNLRSQGIDAS